ncbi:MAG: cytochrome b/b6 domain-containing protein [Actinomycetota bacterium]|nr:cytochrome b/b6 domain-containing protein [Actinomycetota bacterium]
MNSHTFLAKTIHWTFSILYAYGIIKQVDDLDELEDASLLNFEIIFAFVFLIVVMVRFFYMKDVKTLLGANYEMHKGHLFIAKATHRIIYFSLIMLPTTGLLIAGMFNFGILADSYETSFPESFEKNVGMSLDEFYIDFNNFMREGNIDDPPPSGFFPTEPLSKLVNFKK